MKKIIVIALLALGAAVYAMAGEGQIRVVIPAGGSTNVTFNAPRLTYITAMRNVIATNVATVNNVVGTLTTTNGSSVFTGVFIASGLTTNISTSVKANDKDGLADGSTLTFTNSQTARISELTITILTR